LLAIVGARARSVNQPDPAARRRGCAARKTPELPAVDGELALVLAVAVEDLHAPVPRVADVDASLAVDGDADRLLELTLLAAEAAPGLLLGAVGAEAPHLVVAGVDQEDAALAVDRDAARPEERVAELVGYWQMGLNTCTRWFQVSRHRCFEV
jgi:hypothetical protein